MFIPTILPLHLLLIGKKKHCRIVSCNSPCFNRAVRHPPPSQGTSKTATGYLSRSLNTTDNQLPKVVADFQISLSCTDQSGSVAAGAGALDSRHWLNSRETSLFDQSEAEWVLRKARKKESGTVNANSASQPVAGDHRWDNIQRINKGFSSLDVGKNHQALEIAEEILQTHANLILRDRQSAILLKARALFNLKRFDDCLQSIGQLKPPLGKGLLMVKGRALQAKHRFGEALPIFQELDKNHSKKARDKKVNGLALGRLYGDMGLDQEALTIFRKLRTNLSGHEGIPCNDKDIELALGRQYQSMGVHQEALAIFNKLGAECCGHKGTPCNDKDIELSLGRQCQEMGLYQEALTAFKKLRTSRSGHEDTPCTDKEVELALGRLYQHMGLHQAALTIFKKLRTSRCGHEDTPCRDKDIELTLGRQYQEMGLHQEALATFKRLRTERSGHEDTPCSDKDIELTLGRQYQVMGLHQEALATFKKLRTERSGHEDTPCSDKDIELTLGRQYQEMGLHQEALATFKRLRTERSGHEDTPCNDKEVELALGRLYEVMGLYQKALATFKRLRTERSGHEDTPCNDKEVELALGRLYEVMGLDQEALTIFKKLRTDRSGHEDTPCNDKDIELTLGGQYSKMGLYQKALTIFKKLRTDRSGHADTPCSDKYIELALGKVYVDLMKWQQFDQMHLDGKGFTGPEVDLCISIRYFQQCICQDKEISGLLAKAIEHVCNAIEKSHYLNASSFSQLGHCLRIAALLPDEKAADILSKDELNNLAATYFAKANTLSPNRLFQLKNENWRQIEHDFLARGLSENSAPLGVPVARMAEN